MVAYSGLISASVPMAKGYIGGILWLEVLHDCIRLSTCTTISFTLLNLQSGRFSVNLLSGMVLLGHIYQLG